MWTVQSSLAEEEAPAQLAGMEDTCYDIPCQQAVEKAWAAQPCCAQNSQIIESEMFILFLYRFLN